MPSTGSESLSSYTQHHFPTPMESFAWLCDSIPEWLEKLGGLTQRVQVRQDEFERLSISSSAGSMPRIAKRKTGSTESLRPDDNHESTRFSSDVPTSMPTNTEPTTPISPGPKLQVNPNNRRLFQEYRDAARRKRKSTSIHSNTSGPVKFRARMSMVIYYDSDVQSGFESMVRCLASARNTLRKGKNATSYKARMASLAEEESPFDGNRTKFSIRNPRIARFGKGSGPYSMDSLSLEQFDLIDKELEVAQTLCEIGAHQFLRDASSADELAGVRDKLNSCLKLAKEGYEVMKTADEENKLHQKMLAETRKLSEDERTVESTQSDNRTFSSKTYSDSAMGIEVDHGIEIDHHVEIDDEDGISIDIPGPEIEIDIPTVVDVETPKHSLEIDHPSKPTNDHGDLLGPPVKAGDGTIEIGGDSDEESFHIDLSAIRRTR